MKPRSNPRDKKPANALGSPVESQPYPWSQKAGKPRYGIALYHPVTRTTPAPELPLKCVYPRTPNGRPCRNLVTPEQREKHGIGICASCYERMRRRLDPGPLTDAD